MTARCLSAGTLWLGFVCSLACAGDPVVPGLPVAEPSEACTSSPDQAAERFLTILPDALPTRLVRPHFSCTPEGLVGRVDVDAIHRDEATSYLTALIDPRLEALTEANWHRLEIDVRHLPGDLDITAAFVGHEADPMRSLRPLVTAQSQFVLDSMGPRTTTTPEPRASRLEGDITAVLDAARPPGVQFDVEVHAPITRGLNALHPEDKLLATATVRVAVEGMAADREVTVLEWIAAAEDPLAPLKQATFVVSFYADALAGRPPREHPELRRTGWAPMQLPAPHGGLTVPGPTRKHDPGPTVR